VARRLDEAALGVVGAEVRRYRGPPAVGEAEAGHIQGGGAGMGAGPLARPAIDRAAGIGSVVVHPRQPAAHDLARRRDQHLALPQRVAQGQRTGHDRRGGDQATRRPHGVSRRAEAGLACLALGEPHPALAQGGAAGDGVGADPRQLAGRGQADRLVQRERLPRQVLRRRQAVDQGEDQQTGQQQVQQEAGQAGQRPGFGRGFAQDQFHPHPTARRRRSSAVKLGLSGASGHLARRWRRT
jgi:hypothetical protein